MIGFDFIKINYGANTKTFYNDSILTFEENYKQAINVDQLTSRKKIIYYRGNETVTYILSIKANYKATLTDVQDLLEFDGFMTLIKYYNTGTEIDRTTVKINQNATLNYNKGGIDAERPQKIIFHKVYLLDISVFIPGLHQIGV